MLKGRRGRATLGIVTLWWLSPSNRGVVGFRLNFLKLSNKAGMTDLLQL